MKFPSKGIPHTMPTHLGPVPVVRVPRLNDETGDLLGRANFSTREIHLRAEVSPIAARQCLWHEWLHFILTDAGVQLSPEQEESVCDSVATGIAALFT